MDSVHGKMRRNVEGDRLSALPDDLIHKILSFIDIKEAIETSVLSSRWRFIWTSLPYLSFTTEDFSSLPKFSKFVSRVLSHRNNLTEVYSVKLTFRGKVSQVAIKRILNYAFSHNIQQLNVVCLFDNVIEFPLSLFSSQSLKHLSWTMQLDRPRRYHYSSCITSTWELPTLTTLDLHCVTLCVDEADKCIGIFSKCANLKNLRLKEFDIKGSNGFSICHPRLSNLTLENSHYNVKVINVVAPHLQNLNVRFCYAELVISTCVLASLLYKGALPLHISTNSVHSPEKADICVTSPHTAHADQIVCLLQQLHNVKFLSLNLEIVELLSSSVGLHLHQPSPFVNLKSLNIHPERVYWCEEEPPKVAMSTELKRYLLDGSPGAAFTMVLREEILAHKYTTELRVLLEKEKADMAHLDQGKTPVESHKPKVEMKLNSGENIAQIKSCWKNLGVQIEAGNEKANLIISKLQRIEKVLTKLPASKRAKIQPCFSSLCGEAKIAISQITDCMKIQCDENQDRLSFWFHELATKLEPSS
ncbi:hypothetical protein SSX86_029462 [Deinandra increscens subsp. villosa]|uniref:F-box domain-containing protein n=1 Tax=Deinandra increscens subsp. villosa TaxID=3103831 RepID=A0AAP0CEV6_9ASTR